MPTATNPARHPAPRATRAALPDEPGHTTLSRLLACRDDIDAGRLMAAHAQLDAAARRLRERALWMEAALQWRHEALAQRLQDQALRLRQQITEVPDSAASQFEPRPSELAPARPGMPALHAQASPLQPVPAAPASPATDAQRPVAGLDDVVGAEAIKRLLQGRFVLPLRHPERAAQYRQGSGGGLLMYGPPGTGKTYVARALAAELGVPVYVVSPASMLSKWLGESEKQLAALFAQARSHVGGALIFVDEIDALAPARDASAEGGALQRLLTQLLTELDGFEQGSGRLLFLAATNRPWSLDAALLRPGRFDSLAYLGLPDAAARALLLQRTLAGVPQQAGMDWAQAAQALQACSAAETVACARQASRMAFESAVKQGSNRPVLLSDLLAAASGTGHAAAPNMLAQFAKFVQSQGLAVPAELASDLQASRGRNNTPGPSLQASEVTALSNDQACSAPSAAVAWPTLAREVDIALPEVPAAGLAQPFRFVQARDLDLQIEAVPLLCYALQHAGIAPVRQLVLHNHGAEASQNLLVEVSLVPGDYGDSWSTTLAELGAGQRWESGPISLPLRLDRLRAVQERETAHLRVTVRDKDEVLLARTSPLPVLAYNEWVVLPDFLQLCAAYVQPNSAALHPVVQAAAEHLHKATGSRAFPGYQAGQPRQVMAMLQALHQALLHDHPLAYINPPPSFELSGQKVRLVADTLAQGRGTCLDLAVLQAALWEHVGLHACLVLVPGHAFMGCWLQERTAEHAVVSLRARGPSAQHLRADLQAGALCLFNSVEVAHAQPLSAAQAQAARIVSDTLARGEDVQVIDISACRSVVRPLP